MYDIEKIRKDLEEECYAMAFGADIPEALLQIDDIRKASDEEILAMADEIGLRLSKYVIKEHHGWFGK